MRKKKSRQTVILLSEKEATKRIKRLDNRVDQAFNGNLENEEVKARLKRTLLQVLQDCEQVSVLIPSWPLHCRLDRLAGKIVASLGLWCREDVRYELPFPDEVK